MPLDQRKARELFLHAVGKLPPERWEDYVAEGCGGDTELERQVSHLLQVHREAGSFLESPAVALRDLDVDRTFAETPTDEARRLTVAQAGTVIGPYKLLQPIGEGGMGTVYMAEQTQPVRRTVALKLIKAGMDSRQVLARFGAERQALALMDHPNIAKVLDAGATEQGCPYFVMELVKGIPITRFCDERRMTLRERLELAIPVCQAVQHAHLKGIIHRDLKPSNVLIALYDGKPVPKIIDFGLAKATGPRLTDQTLYTEFGAVVGTLEYMSPEQAELNQLDIDTRSDIYSLGVLIYELLTGSTPLDQKRVKSVLFLEVLRLIREEESPRPSRRLSTTEELPSIAACRHVEPRKLRGLVRGELDWIVMKALEKDRNRRYETANDLAADLQHYLDDEPVKACPPSATYRLRKLVRRNRVVLSTLAVVCLALIAGTAVATWQAIRATNAERLARTRMQAEIKAQSATLAQLHLTEVAEDRAMHRLFDSRLAQARAGALSRRVGQRFDSLGAVAQALKISRDLNLGEDRLLDLRNAAIACLALPDMRNVKKWNSWPNTWSVSFDNTLERYARVDRQGVVHIQRGADDAEISLFPGMGPLEAWTRFSPDGHFLALASVDNQFEVWNLAGSKPVVVVERLRAPGGAGFSPDSRRLAVGGADGFVRLYELPSGRQVKQLEAAPSHGRMAFHPEGRQLAVSCATGIRVYDLETGRTVADLRQPSETSSIAWHPDGKTLAAACDDWRIYLWDVALGKRTHVLEGCQGKGITIAFNHNGDLLVGGGWEGVLRLWDPRRGRQLFSTLALTNVFFSLDDHLLAYDIREGKLGSWEVAAGGEYRALARAAAAAKDSYQISAIRCDGRLLAVGMGEGVGLWDLKGGKELAFLESPGTSFVLFEPSGALLTNGSAGLLRWPIQADAASPGLLRIEAPHKLSVPGAVCHIACSEDGRVTAVSQFEGGRVLHAERPDQPVPIGPHGDARYVAVSPDGRWVVTGAHNGTGVKIWEAGSGEFVKELLIEGASRVGFSPDGRWLATTGGGLRLWAVGSWREGSQIGGGAAFAFSPDGTLLAAETGHGAVRLVDPDTGQEYARLENPNQDRAFFLSFGRDGMQLVITEGDAQSFHVWDLRAIRKQLAQTGLDWALPRYPPAPEVKETQPLRIQIELRDAAQLLRDREGATRRMIERNRRALEADPNNAQTCNSLAWALLTAPKALRDWQAALPIAQRAVQLDPGPMNRNTLGLAYYRAGRFREAANTLQINLKDQVDWALPFDLYILAMSHHQLGESAQARQSLELAARWSDAHQDALKPYMVDLAALGSEAAALLGANKTQD
jgi:eukaryotic-like serine/threonine-protein kinase